MRSKNSRVIFASSSPVGVRVTPRTVRLNSFRPQRSSRVLTWWLIALWVTFSSCAALVKLM